MAFKTQQTCLTIASLTTQERAIAVQIGSIQSALELPGLVARIPIEEKVATFVLKSNGSEHQLRRNLTGGGWYEVTPGSESLVWSDVNQNRDSVILGRSEVYGGSLSNGVLVVKSKLHGLSAYGQKVITNTTVDGAIEMDGNVTRSDGSTFNGVFKAAGGVYEGGIFRSEKDTIRYQKERCKDERRRLKQQRRPTGILSTGAPSQEGLQHVEARD